MDEPLAVPFVVMVAASLVAAVTDLMRFKVNNALTLPLLLAGLLYHGLSGGGAGLVFSAQGALFGFAITIPFYALGGMGGGDVKLLTASGAWLGVPLTLLVFVASTVVAGLYALVVVLACGRFRETWVNLQIIWHRMAALGRHLGAEDRVEAELARPDRRLRVVPFATMVAFSISALLVCAWLISVSTGGSP